MRALSTLLFLIVFHPAIASDSLCISFSPFTATPKIKLLSKQWIKTANNDSFLVSDFRFYISNIQLKKEGKTVYSDSTMGYLIQPLSDTKNKITIKANSIPAFDELVLGIGIDSLTSVDGPKSNDLDPVHGLYWTWQSGYINLRLEGQHSSSTLPEKEFFYHLGGYSGINNCYQSKTFRVSKTATIHLGINLLGFMHEATKTSTWKIMSPRKEAVQLAKTFSNSLVVFIP